MMAPMHARLARLLASAASERGGQAALARELRIDPTEVSDLINERRFITYRQALAVEEVLGVNAEDLLIEAAAQRVREKLPRERAKYAAKRDE